MEEDDQFEMVRVATLSLSVKSEETERESHFENGNMWLIQRSFISRPFVVAL